jgi:hypothetical protein
MRAQDRLAGPGHAPEAEVALLRAHFAAVDVWLRERSALSLALALARIETDRGLAFAPGEREGLHAELTEARGRQLAALEAYSSRGRFPLNPDVGGRSTPLFVDASDTACAVGHLMRRDGRADQVARIAALGNDVFVEDAGSGSIADWALTSGLTIEEAAVIQPTYPPPVGTPLTVLGEPGGFIEQDGLRIDNFEVAVFVDYNPFYFDPLYEELCFLDPGVGTCDRILLPEWAPPLSAVEVRVGEGGIPAEEWGFPIWAPMSHVLFWHASSYVILNAQYIPEEFLPAMARTEIRYDLSVIDPDLGIDSVAFGFEDGYFFWEDAYSGGPDLAVTALLTDGNEVLGSALVNADGPISFEPRNRIRVLVAGHLGETDLWSTLTQDVNVVPVPEPSFALSLAAGLVGVAGLHRRRTTRSAGRKNSTGVA